MAAASYTNTQPVAYTTPPFPSLYWPFHVSPGVAQYLYSTTDIWRFTLYWTLITIPLAHFFAAITAILMQFSSAYQCRMYISKPATRAKLSAKNKKLLGERPMRNTLKWVWVIMGVYMIIGAIEALIAGSLVGLVLGAVYNAGFFRMSVWTPLFWGIINMLVLILSSFRISGGL